MVGGPGPAGGRPVAAPHPRASRLSGRSAEGAEDTGDEELAAALGGCGLPVRREAEPGARHAAVVVDATGIRAVAELRGVHSALHPVMRSVAECGRIVVLGSRPEPEDHHQAAAQQALEGLVRSLAKETGGGRTVQLLRFASGTRPAAAASTLEFLLSPKSAYVSGQVVEIGSNGASTNSPSTNRASAEGTDTDGRDTGEPGADRPGADAVPDRLRGGDALRPSAGRTALVTGSARGIGRSVATTLARDGAHVICLDVPQAEDDLGRVARELGGSAVTLDITADDAGERLVEALSSHAGDGLDVLVHNAGITRDRKLANMGADRWDSVLDVNLDSVLRTTDHLLKTGTLRPGTGRIVATASVAGIAGNAGQTHYGASKAGVIGLVRSLAPGRRPSTG